MCGIIQSPIVSMYSARSRLVTGVPSPASGHSALSGFEIAMFLTVARSRVAGAREDLLGILERLSAQRRHVGDRRCVGEQHGLQAGVFQLQFERTAQQHVECSTWVVLRSGVACERTEPAHRPLGERGRQGFDRRKVAVDGTHAHAGTACDLVEAQVRALAAMRGLEDAGATACGIRSKCGHVIDLS